MIEYPTGKFNSIYVWFDIFSIGGTVKISAFCVQYILRILTVKDQRIFNSYKHKTKLNQLNSYIKPIA